MKPEYIKIAYSIVNLSHISCMSPLPNGFLIYLSGEEQIEVSEEEGRSLWNWLHQKAITPDQLMTV